MQYAKTRTLSRAVVEALGGTQHVTYICHDYYYKDLSHLAMEERAKTNFDHPDALETSLLVQQLGRPSARLVFVCFGSLQKTQHLYLHSENSYFFTEYELHAS